MEEVEEEEEEKQVAQGQYVVSDTRCPALHGCEFEGGSRAVAWKGTKSYRLKGNFHLFARLYMV